MVVGVNGVGKTTTIGKLASNYKTAERKVLIGAADTFRAAANEQLEIWANRAGVDIIQQKQGADPAAVAFDTVKAAQARGSEVVIIDTAGRLHNKTNLMTELEKISRVMKKLKDSAPDDIFLVLDATTGQNAIQQAKEFMKVAPITGIVLTKLDGTAKGGVVISIANELKFRLDILELGRKLTISNHLIRLNLSKRYLLNQVKQTKQVKDKMNNNFSKIILAVFVSCLFSTPLFSQGLYFNANSGIAFGVSNSSISNTNEPLLHIVMIM